MDKSSKKTSAFGLSGEKIARLLSIGREDESSGVVREDRYSAELRIEGYEIIEKIAEAGQGQVWRAIQLSTGRQVAIKAPRVESLNSEGVMLRFEREIELIARLERLVGERVLSRFGPMYDAEKMGGAVTLCAMAVPGRGRRCPHPP